MSFGHPEWLLLAIPLLALWSFAFGALGRARWLRLLLACCLPLALAEPAIDGAPPAARSIVLIDRSLSVGDQAPARGLAIAEELRQAMDGSAHELFVLGFGRGASVLARPGEPLDALRGLPAHDDSDLTAGLRLASLHAGAGAELIVVSDGIFTGDDPRLEAPDLRQRGVRVHTLALHRERGADSAIARVVAPARVPAGQAFALGVEVSAEAAADARLSIHDARGRELGASAVRLSPGSQRFAVPIRPTRVGLEVLEARIEVAGGDPRPQNDRARAAVTVVGAPRVRVWSSGEQESALLRALQSAGVAVELAAPGEALSSAGLIGVSAVVLENVPLDRLGDGADAALDHYVRELGGGLIVTGGRQSYALGGYFRSRLEGLLPVVMDRQDELRRPRLDMAIALDRSGSMGAPVGSGATKMDLANRGAAEAIDLLAPGDKLGVLAVDSAAHAVAKLTEIGSAEQRDALREKVLAIESGGGGIFVHTGLAAAMDMLLAGDAPTRHVILFADAADAEEPGDYRGLIARWVDAGGSLSVIGLGTPADVDAELLREIARLGGGECYFTADAMQLPRVFAQDVIYVSRKAFLEQTTAVEPARGLLMLDLPVRAAPPVDGYNLTFLAPEAEAVLISGDDNHAPLAAAFQRGNGKVVAMTFEADGPYTGALADWPDYKRFFRAALEWARATRSAPEVGTDMTLEGRRATIEVELDPELEAPGRATAVVLGPDARDAERLPLRWAGPHRLTATLEVDSDGVYHGVVQLEGQPPIALPSVMLPYSPEFAPRKAGQSGAQVLEQLARETGGAPLLHVDALRARPPQTRPDGRPLAAWLIGAMLLLLLLDIAHRRGLTLPALARAGQLARRARRPRQGSVRPSEARDDGARAAETKRSDGPPAGPAAPDAPAQQAPPPAESALARAKRRARLR